MEENQNLIQTIIEGIQEKKGKQIVTVDLTNIDSSSAQYFIICQGGSPAQVAAIADSVRETTLEKIGVKPFNYDGYIKQVKEGDTTISWGDKNNGETPESRFDDFVNYLQRGYDKWIVRRRRLTW